MLSGEDSIVSVAFLNSKFIRESWLGYKKILQKTIFTILAIVISTSIASAVECGSEIKISVSSDIKYMAMTSAELIETNLINPDNGPCFTEVKTIENQNTIEVLSNLSHDRTQFSLMSLKSFMQIQPASEWTEIDNSSLINGLTSFKYENASELVADYPNGRAANQEYVNIGDFIILSVMPTTARMSTWTSNANGHFNYAEQNIDLMQQDEVPFQKMIKKPINFAPQVVITTQGFWSHLDKNQRDDYSVRISEATAVLADSVDEKLKKSEAAVWRDDVTYANPTAVWAPILMPGTELTCAANQCPCLGSNVCTEDCCNNN